MTSHVKLRKERVGLVDYDTQIKGKIKTFIATPDSLLQPILTVIVCCSCGKQKPCKNLFLTYCKTFRMSHILSCVCVCVSPLFCSLSEVRCQLVDQLKVLDLQLEQKSQQLQDLTDYLRRRGEIESEYARSLDKLAERFTSRTKR